MVSLTKKGRKMKGQNPIFNITWFGTFMLVHTIAVLLCCYYTYSIGNHSKIMMMMFQILENIRYNSICNVLYLWSIPGS